MSSPILPPTYKAAVVETVEGELKLVDRPLEKPSAGQVLVKVLACGVCHSDFGIKAGMAPLPRVPGHEIVGDVVAIGPGEERWKVGDRVGSGWHGGHCGHCDFCLAGDPVNCETAKWNGIAFDGGYAEYVLLRTEAVVTIPRDVDPAEAAPFLCAGVTVFNSMRNMGCKPGALVAVQGIGGLGHLAVQYAAKMGMRVVALSTSPSKKQLATDLGARYYFDSSSVDQAAELKKLGGADLIVCTAPHGDILTQLLPALAPGGTILLLAVPRTALSFPPFPLISRRLSIKGWFVGSPKDSEETVAFSRDQGVHAIVEKFKLEDAEKAFQRMASGKANIRVVLEPW